MNKSNSLASQVVRLADDADARVRFAAALALGNIPGPEALAALARIARRDMGDRWTRTAVLIAVPDRSGKLLELLLNDPKAQHERAEADFAGQLAQVVGIRHDPAEVGQTLQAIGTPALSQATREALVRHLADGLSRSGGGSLAEQLDRAPDSVRESLAALFTEAAKTAGDASRKSTDRVQAIHLLAFARHKDTAALFTTLLDPTQPQNVASAVIAAIAASDDPQAGVVLIKQWTRLGPALRNDVFEALFRRPERIAALLDALDQKKIPPGEIEAGRRQFLLKNSGENVRARAETIFGGQVNADRQKLIDHYRQAVARLDGDPDRGAVVFKTTCFQCHGKAPGGERVGPDLSTLEDRSPPTLLIAILDPNREVKPIYVSYDLETVDGQEYLGVVASETANSVTIRRAGGLEDIVLRTRIKSLRSTGLSLMPDGLEAGINVQQMADLLQYLRDFREH